jgi:hypothetical protein
MWNILAILTVGIAAWTATLYLIMTSISKLIGGL